MTELDILIKTAFENPNEPKHAANVYHALFKTSLYLPCRKLTEEEQKAIPAGEPPFVPLYTEHDGNYYVVVFDTEERLNHWAGDYRNTMDHTTLQGSDLILGLGEKVFMCLNFATEYYKEFSPQEIATLKGILLKEAK